MSAPSPSHGQIVKLAWPIILANITVPLLSLADVAVIGHTGDVADLGAIALGALIFNFVYWGFSFLRMSTTGFIAQAAGCRDELEVRAICLRALGMALCIGLSLIVLQQLISTVALHLLSASTEVESIARDYVLIRIWGAPACLALYACLGALIGLGYGKELLLIQVVLNGLNILLDILFAGVFDWGASGIALGTALAEWISLVFALCVLFRILARRHNKLSPWWPRQQLRDIQRLRQLLTANRDILLRTLFLLFSFAWFTNLSASFGDVNLAANHVLLQLIAFAAFFLDGYAHVAESLVGRAIGAHQTRSFDIVVRRSSHIAVITAIGLCVLFWMFSPLFLQLLTTHQSIQQQTLTFLPFALVYILLSCAAFQLDGIFIGATRTQDMRNASIAASLLFIGLSLLLIELWGNGGLWVAFIAYVSLRAVCLMAYYPALRRSLA
ncbi:MAG: MATE family efflux transporter [Oceanococcus sp.]